MKKFLFGLLAASIVITTAQAAQAQRTVRFRPHLEMNLFSLDAGRVKTESNGVTSKSKFVSPNFGLGRSDAGPSGFAAPLGFGFGVEIKQMIVIGARFALGIQKDNGEIETEGNGGSATVNLGATKYFYFHLIPYFEFIFIPTGPVRPFVTAQIGFQASRNKSEPPNNGRESSDGPNLFVFGAGGGAHFFLAESFSIDATMMMSMGAGRMSQDPSPAGTLD